MKDDINLGTNDAGKEPQTEDQMPMNGQGEAVQPEHGQQPDQPVQSVPAEPDGQPEKKKKNKGGFGKGVIVGVAATLAVFLIAAAGIGYVVWKDYSQAFTYENLTTPEHVPDNSGELDMDKIESKLNLLQEYISEYFLYDEDMEAAEDGIYKGFISGLDDKYATYYTKEEFDSLIESTNGTYSGIGALLQQNATTKIMSVVKVFAGSPAEEAGLKAGDIFYKVGDEDITALDLDILVSKYIRGEEGTDVTLTVLRGEEYEEVTMTITRRTIEVPTVEHKMLSDNIGYIAVSEFESPTVEQYKEAVDDLTDQGMTSLVIDLRDNPGGLVDTSVSMLEYTLPDGLYTYTADKNGNGQKYLGNDDHEIDVPIVILVNGNSASASEIFSGAMRDYEKATLLGTTTYGKGIVQSVFSLGDGTGLKITTMHYYTPNGTDLHGEGLAPDIEVEWDKEGTAGEEGNDNQLDAAIEYLKTGKVTEL